MSATPERGRWQPDAARLHHEPEAVRWARKRAGLTVTALARAISVSPSLITEIEQGTRNATPERLKQIAVAVDCPVVMLRSKRQSTGAAA